MQAGRRIGVMLGGGNIDLELLHCRVLGSGPQLWHPLPILSWRAVASRRGSVADSECHPDLSRHREQRCRRAHHCLQWQRGEPYATGTELHEG